MLSELLNKLGDLILEMPPFAILQPDEGGVLVRLGRVRKPLGPGFHWKMPFVDLVRKTTVSEQTIDMPVQTVGTADGKTVTASGYIRYKISDPAKALLTLFDYDLSLPREAMKEIASVISSHPLLSQGVVEAAVEESLEHFEAHGIDVIDFGLTDYSVTIALRLIQN